MWWCNHKTKEMIEKMPTFADFVELIKSGSKEGEQVIANKHPKKIQTERLTLIREINLINDVRYKIRFGEEVIGQIQILHRGEVKYEFFNPKRYGRRGMMTEALKAVLEKTPRRHLFVIIDDWNFKSKAVALKCGFQLLNNTDSAYESLHQGYQTYGYEKNTTQK